MAAVAHGNDIENNQNALKLYFVYNYQRSTSELCTNMGAKITLTPAHVGPMGPRGVLKCKISHKLLGICQ